jgi:hypothetical protein
MTAMNNPHHPPALPALRSILCPQCIEGAIARGLTAIGAAQIVLAVLHWIPATPAANGILGILVLAGVLAAIAIHRSDRTSSMALLAYATLGATGAIAALAIRYVEGL